MSLREARVAIASGLVVLVALVVPVFGDSRLPLTASLLVPAVLAVGSMMSVVAGAGRALLGVLVMGWAAMVLGHGSPAVGTVLVTAVLLRLWAGLPELVKLGADGLADLGVDVGTGLVVAVLVLRFAQGGQSGGPVVVLVGVLSAAAIAALTVLRLRR